MAKIKNRTLVIMWCLLACVSCKDGTTPTAPDHNPAYMETEDLLEDLSLDNIKIITIDSCEYIVYRHEEGTHGFGFMSHKGNCKNPIHAHNQ